MVPCDNKVHARGKDVKRHRRADQAPCDFPERAARLMKPRVKPRILIVGANFAGIAAAQHLDRRYDVTVVDRSPWFEWLPNIHELLSGVKRAADLRLPRARLVKRAGHRFVTAEVVRIDARRGSALLAAGKSIEFDACIVAVGGVHDTFGVRGAEQHALAFKGVDDCAGIGREIARLRRRGDRAHRPQVVIVGGGLEGIEGLGEILRGERRRRSLDVTLVEAGPRLLPDMPATLDARVRAHCAAFDVRLLTRTRVTAVTPRRVRLDSGEVLRSDLTIWTGGSAPAPLLRASGMAARAGQWAEVTAALQSRRHANVFVIGDAAALPSPLSKQAYHALDMGKVRSRQRVALAAWSAAAPLSRRAQADAGCVWRPGHVPRDRAQCAGVDGARGRQGEHLPAHHGAARPAVGTGPLRAAHEPTAPRRTPVRTACSRNFAARLAAGCRRGVGLRCCHQQRRAPAQHLAGWHVA